MLMQKAKEPKFWEQVRTDAAYTEMVDWLKAHYRDSYMEEIPTLKYSARTRYYVDGDRNDFQIPYCRRREFMTTAALLAMIYPEEQHYMDEVQQILWAICDEYSWALPAHCVSALEDDLTNVDLFNAETGFAVAELCYLLEDRLDALVLNRARQEVRRRVIDNYLSRTFFWETKTNNWAAVCGGSVGGILLYLEPEILKEQLPRLLSGLRYFLASFPEDGTCLEGFHYWHYGFGNFIWFADLLYQFTQGEVNLFTWDKVEAVAGYAQRSVLRGNTTVSYSDGSREAEADRAMNHYLARLFPDSVRFLPKKYTVFSKINSTWIYALRNLLYVDFHMEDVEFVLKNHDLPGAGQVVVNFQNYSLAVKAGHNAEPHNHNDVGCFILSTDRGQIFCDLGAGMYTKQYFRNRYSVFCNASRGHSVPIVNGKEQLPGGEYGGTLTHEGNVITMEIDGAYGQPGFTKLTRTFVYEEDRVVLTDTVASDYESLTERFVTTFKPKVLKDWIMVGNVALLFESEKVTVKTSEVVHERHGYFDGTELVYCIDFELKPGLEEIRFVMITEK